MNSLSIGKTYLTQQLIFRTQKRVCKAPNSYIRTCFHIREAECVELVSPLLKENAKALLRDLPERVELNSRTASLISEIGHRVGTQFDQLYSNKKKSEDPCYLRGSFL
ncbi:MAG: hypothetical protein WCH11_05320 [Bdellovibrio sp.]